METTDVPVLVTGAGPAGLATAISLARCGIEVLVAERRRELSRLPRATVISTRSMELLRGWGLEGSVLAGGVDVEWRMWVSETLAQAATGSALTVGYPSQEQAALVSPSAPACVPQDHLEQVLLEHLRSLPAAQVLLGTEVISVDISAQGVEAVLREATGRRRRVRADYLAAADGAHSMVRAAAGISMRGPERLLEGVTALFHAPLWDVLAEHRYGIYFVTNQEAEGVFLPAGPGDRWLYGGRIGTLSDLQPQAAEAFTRLIRIGAGVGDLDVRIERIGAWTSASQLAERFRLGRTFLVGDAAHRVTPRGGTGMNIALQDGCDLGWKLAWVLRGWAAPEMLDSYEAERRPLAEHNAVRSADPNGSVRDVDQELFADLGGRIRHLWVTTRSERVSTLDLLGPGMTLFTGPETQRWATAVAATKQPVPIELRSVDAITAHSLGIHDGAALLVRPDGVPAGWLPRVENAGSALSSALDWFLGRSAGTGVTGDRAVA